MVGQFTYNFEYVKGVSYFYNEEGVFVKGPLGVVLVRVNAHFGIGIRFLEGKNLICVFGDKKHACTFVKHLENASIGVTSGFLKVLSLVGVGYRAFVEGDTLRLKLGFSHDVLYEVPLGIKVSVQNNTNLYVFGINKDLVGIVSDTIRSFRPPESYKGKGVRYEGETIHLKEIKKR